MASLAERVDAIVGIDTHRDTHEAEIADANGTAIAAVQISNDSVGFADLLAWIAEHAPGPRIVISVEGTRSYGLGLARALTAAGMLVLECEQPTRTQRRGKGKSDPIDAHLAVLAALRLDADRLPAMRADGDREALRILLGARQDIITASTAQTNRLRALLLTGEDADRHAARGTFNDAVLSTLARRRLRSDATRADTIRHAEIRRLALALRDADRQLKDNRKQLTNLVEDLAPGLTGHYGIGPVTAAQAIVSFSHPGRAGRHQPDTSQQRTNRSTPAQPRRRPSTQPRRAHHRADPHTQLPTHPRLRHPTHHRRQKPTQNPTLPQALHHPRALPHPQPINDPADPPERRLTNIEASSIGDCTCSSSHTPSASSGPPRRAAPCGTNGGTARLRWP
jgi:transposase